MKSPLQSMLCQAALLYANRYGFRVFPCKERAKVPATRNGCKDATREPQQIEAWWRTNPRFNVGVACGEELLVLDVDGDEGLASLNKLENANGRLPLTPMSITGRGYQYFFKSNENFPNRVAFAPGIDVRSAGGYVVVAPSIHPSGKQYAWEVSARIDEVAMAKVPLWLGDLIGKVRSDTNRSITWESLAANGSVEGSRNFTVASLAGMLLRKYVDPRAALELILSWNKIKNRPPLADDEVVRTVGSIAKAELKRRTKLVNKVNDDE